MFETVILARVVTIVLCLGGHSLIHVPLVSLLTDGIMYIRRSIIIFFIKKNLIS